MSEPVDIVLVYQSLLGIYGDRGNAMVLRSRLAWRGIEARLIEVEPGTPVPAGAPSGYRELLIAREGLSAPQSLADPDGNRVTLVPPGTFGISRIGVKLAVRDAAAHRRFYAIALGLPDVPEAGGNSFYWGDSVVMFEEADDAPADAALEGTGFRYLTVQVWKTDEEHQGVLARGGREGRAPQTLGKVARISFVRDPDGNWIEISQRASLTGSLD